MSPTRLFRLSGLALLVALPLQALGSALRGPGHDPGYLINPTANVLLIGSWLLATFGLVGLYVRQADHAGIPGLIGFVLMVLVAVASIDTFIFESFAAPLIAQSAAAQPLVGQDGPLAHGALRGALVNLPLLTFGVLLFGIATVRAGVLPRWTGLLPIAGIVALYAGIPLMRVPLPVSPLQICYGLMFLGYAWGGHTLWTLHAQEGAASRRTAVAQPAA
jgi:hypothetical protein